MTNFELTAETRKALKKIARNAELCEMIRHLAADMPAEADTYKSALFGALTAAFMGAGMSWGNVQAGGVAEILRNAFRWDGSGGDWLNGVIADFDALN